MKIVIDDLSSKDIAQFLEEHIADMWAASPPGSVHALDLQALRSSDISFWSVLDQHSKIVACGGLKELDSQHGEIKSMRTSAACRGLGIASQLLQHILDIAKSRAYQRLSLETGSMGFFIPARELYARHGFQVCSPFADYKEDPNSVFMSRLL